MISPINAIDYDAIKTIWQEAFDDDENYIHAFLKQYDPVCGLKYTHNGTVVSMLFMIPCQLQDRTFYYLYACATLKKFQGQHFMSLLLEAAFQQAQLEHAFGLILIPSNTQLFQYYERQGFSMGTSVLEQIFCDDKTSSDYSCEKTDEMDSVIKLRHRIYDKSSAFSFNDSHLSFYQAHFLKNSGETLIVSDNVKKGYAFCLHNRIENKVFVIEWGIIADDPHKELPELAKAIGRFFGVSIVKVRSKNENNMKGDRPFTMVKFCNKPIALNHIYFNLGLD